MNWVAGRRCNRLMPAIKAACECYQAIPNREEQLAWQLDQFNGLWKDIAQRVPAWRQMVESGKAPVRFDSWGQMLECLPPINRHQLQGAIGSYSDSSRPADFYRITGGSTAEPVQLPAWNEESTDLEANHWAGRHWYGVTPADRLFLIWGHSHLLGSGFRGWINKHKRRFKDYLLNYYRYSAYDISPASMRRAADVMIHFRPELLIGYSVALDTFARANADRAEQLRRLPLKVIVATAESFPDEHSADRLRELFGCPVTMEYGSVETGTMGVIHPSGEYRVFWKNFFVEAVDPDPAGGRTVRITSLYPRAFPLIRYELGDRVELIEPDDGIGVTRLAKVIGRCNAFIGLSDGSQVHSELFTHAVKASPQVTRFQVIQKGDQLSLLLVAPGGPAGEIKKDVLNRLTLINPLLSSVNIRFVDALQQTIAGKTPMIVRER